MRVHGLRGGTGIYRPSYGGSHGKPGMEGNWRRYQCQNRREGGVGESTYCSSRIWMALFKKRYPTGRLRTSSVPVSADVFVITVPTPLTASKQPDCEFVVSAIRSIAPKLRRRESGDTGVDMPCGYNGCDERSHRQHASRSLPARPLGCRCQYSYGLLSGTRIAWANSDRIAGKRPVDRRRIGEVHRTSR